MPLDFELATTPAGKIDLSHLSSEEQTAFQDFRDNLRQMRGDGFEGRQRPKRRQNDKS